MLWFFAMILVFALTIRYLVKIYKEKALDKSAPSMPSFHVKVISSRRFSENGYVTVEESSGNRIELFVRIEKGPISTFQPGDTGALKHTKGQLIEFVRDR